MRRWSTPTPTPKPQVGKHSGPWVLGSEVLTGEVLPISQDHEQRRWDNGRLWLPVAGEGHHPCLFPVAGDNLSTRSGCSKAHGPVSQVWEGPGWTAAWGLTEPRDGLLTAALTGEAAALPTQVVGRSSSV